MQSWTAIVHFKTSQMFVTCFYVYVFDIFYVVWKYICTRSHRSRSVCLLMSFLKTKHFMIFPLNVADIIEIPVLSFLGRLSFSHVLCLRRFVTSLSLRGSNVPSVYMNPAHKPFYRPIRPHHSAKPINGFTSLIMYFGGLQRAAEYQLSLHCGSCYRPTAQWRIPVFPVNFLWSSFVDSTRVCWG